MGEDELLLALIKDHIISSRLVNGLYAIGIEADIFCSNLSNVIFVFAGLDDRKELSESRYDFYLALVERISSFGPDEWRNEVDPLAREAYATILSWQVDDFGADPANFLNYESCTST